MWSYIEDVDDAGDVGVGAEVVAGNQGPVHTVRHSHHVCNQGDTISSRALSNSNPDPGKYEPVQP